ncbi:MAG TPA: hypothetical protein VEL07_06190 [Planctomycetota bacterium]|nr:hypothetical protein [Planctomycetota bacterium]
MPINFGITNYNTGPSQFTHPGWGYPHCARPFTAFHYVMIDLKDPYGNDVPDEPQYFETFIAVYFPTLREFRLWYSKGRGPHWGGTMRWEWGYGSDASQVAEFQRYAPNGPMAAALTLTVDAGYDLCHPDFFANVVGGPLPVIPGPAAPCSSCPCP